MSLLTAPFRRTKRYRRWMERIEAEVATEPECKKRFRDEMALPGGRTFMRALRVFAAVTVGWIVLAYAWPDGEGGLRIVLTTALAVTALKLGQAMGWLAGARETYAWTHGEERKREDDAFDRDPELWAGRKSGEG